MIDDLVIELGHAMHGPSRAKRRLLDEAAAGLSDAALAYQHAGWDQPAAAARAVADLGAVPQVAPTFQAELDVVRARRCALITAVSMPLLALLWNRVSEANPYQRWNLPALALIIGIAAATIAIGTSVASTAVLLMTGRLTRRASTPSLLRAVAMIARTGACAFALSCAMVAIGTPEAMRWAPMIPTLLFTTTVLALVTVSGRHSPATACRT